MAFFEELGSKISKGSQDAVQKTKDMASVVNLTNENNSLDKKNVTIKNQMGISLYDAIFEKMSLEDTANTESPVQLPAELWSNLCQMAAEIKKNEQTKLDNNEKIRDLKGERLCPKCGKLLPREAAFCTACGEKLPMPEPAQAPVPAGKVCPNCGKQLSDDAVFCTSCGTRIEGEE
ncbi:replication restart DNA helicase PriA [Butyrivibrio sp. ob235]|uniref:zinc ribbon domain-containing protein n=1 Tax=unclassified Butyrivibrio TaxID=2639466 RepID=UPI0003B6A481|nr:MULTISPECIES: zinc ribbon domain-containing protein [unclassified Butyrivibrio]SEK65894.1 replication restart DNA helicase PriA [Butyrivibrio sp. ob235]